MKSEMRFVNALRAALGLSDLYSERTGLTIARACEGCGKPPPEPQASLLPLVRG